MTRRQILAAVISAAAFALAACGGSTTANDEPSTSESSEPEAAAIDYQNLDWVFRPGGNVLETRQIAVADGSAEVDGIQYVTGDPVISDVNDDGVDDAAVMIEATEGNGIDRQWYLWITTDDGPVQSTMPIARMSRCGTTVHSVTAVEGGIEVHETRRSPYQSSLPCDQDGDDERTRTVTAAPVGPQESWWPVQTAPIGGFGGLCPTAQELDGFDHAEPLYAAPNSESTEMTGGEPVYIFAVEPWPVYGEDVGVGFTLVAVKKDDHLGCAWAQTA